MAVTLHDLVTDPALFLFELDGDHAVFQTMAREQLARSIFLDGRIRHGNRPSFRVPLASLLAASAQFRAGSGRICWIFHVAQCGSTLLARALDHPGRSLVLREPLALRRLGVMTGAGETPGRSEVSSELLDVVTAALGKRWESDRPVVVKANVPVNFIAGRLLALDPQAPAILLHFPLAAYVAAILRTEGHVRWTEDVFAELRIGESACCTGAPPRTAPEKAAALWFAQMLAFVRLQADFPNAYSLSAAEFFDRPAPTIDAAARLFGVVLAEGEAERIVLGELFRTYSKNPALDYDPEVRLAREVEAMRRLAREIAEARAWAESARARHGLPVALDRPLVGDPVALLP